MATEEREEFLSLLHPPVATDVPVPGFASHDALVAWAKTKDPEAIKEAALDTLRDDEWPQQYAAMGLLRELGISVEGEGYGDAFRWIVLLGERRVVIEPRLMPSAQNAADSSAIELESFFTKLPAHRESSRGLEPWASELRGLVAHAINQLDDPPKTALVLHYFEGLRHDEVAEVLGIPKASVEGILRQALREVRNHLRPSARQGVRFYLEEALGAAPLDTPALAFAAILAA